MASAWDGKTRNGKRYKKEEGWVQPRISKKKENEKETEKEIDMEISTVTQPSEKEVLPKCRICQQPASEKESDVYECEGCDYLVHGECSDKCVKCDKERCNHCLEACGTCTKKYCMDIKECVELSHCDGCQRGFCPCTKLTNCVVCQDQFCKVCTANDLHKCASCGHDTCHSTCLRECKVCKCTNTCSLCWTKYKGECKDCHDNIR